MKIVKFSRSPTPLSIYLQNFYSLHLGRPISNKPHPPPNDMQSIKRKHNPGMFVFIGFCFQYQLINLFWFSFFTSMEQQPRAPKLKQKQNQARLIQIDHALYIYFFIYSKLYCSTETHIHTYIHIY